MVGATRRADTGGRLWRSADVAVLLFLNAGGLVMGAIAWAGARERTTLSDQASLIALAVGGLVVAALGDAFFLLGGKSAVAGRAGALLRPDLAGARELAAPVAIVVAVPLAVTGWSAASPGAAPSAGPSRRRMSWCRRYWDRLLGIGAGGAGFVALLAGWYGLSGVVVDHRQVPWVLGGSLLGLWLLGVAGTAWLGAALSDQWSALGRIAGRLAELGVPSLAEIPAPCRTELRGADGIPALL